MEHTVLVIEDDPLNMKLMRGLLGLGGYRMLEADKAETGLQMAADHRPDLILMDVHLPGLDGLSATRRLKADPELAAIPVIALTGLAMEGDREKALEAGCMDHITKPINTRSFLEGLGSFLAPGLGQAFTETPTQGVARRQYSRILVVDDDPMNVKLVEGILKKDGYESIKAFGGEEALAKVRSERPDLILLDVMMPGMDGYEVTRRLKADSATAAIPIIMITALNGTEDKVCGLECGADEFLTKPVNAAELLARTKSMLRLKQYQDQLMLRTRSETAFGEGHGPLAAAPDRPRRQHVLLVEDNDKDLRLLSGQIEDHGYDVSVAHDGEEALQRILAGGVDLVLLDIFLPGMDGFEVCQRLKESAETRDIQVALITCLKDLEGKIKGMKLGADDYLVKPVDGRELSVRVKALLAKKSYLDQLHAHYEQALSSAISDGLTKLYNQTYFKKYLDLELKRSLRQNYPTSLLMLDLDDFKSVNDRFGHPAGDMVLQETARLIREAIREVDLAARYGGEEFAVVLPYSDAKGARVVARRILIALRKLNLENASGAPIGTITASIGIAACPDDAQDARTLIQQADAMLYQAKQSGKNRIEMLPD
ncbi:MAG: response regulator [Desulfobacterales bacterium]|nr:response regulator [Desulfobacterales bacterium]